MISVMIMINSNPISVVHAVRSDKEPNEKGEERYYILDNCTMEATDKFILHRQSDGARKLSQKLLEE